MNIKVFQNRKIEKDYFYNEGTQNENKSTVLTFEVPLGYEDFSKRIVFITEDGNFWDYIPENEYEIKNNITKYGTVKAYLWLTKDDQDFRSQNFELNFYDNENADDLVPTEEETDGFKTLIAELDLKIAEVEELKNTIYQLQENVDNALIELDKKQQNYEQRFQNIDNKLELKLDEVKANPFVKNVQYDNKTATFTFTAYDNTQIIVDLPIEGTVKDGGYDPETQELYLVLVSGQEIRIPATDLVNDYEGLETATIQILISADNKITANIKGGSITENLLSQEVAAKLNKVIDLTPYITKQESYEVFYTKQEVDEMVKEIQETNEYQSEIIDQFKNEFKQITVSGDSIYIPDAAELPMELVPYGEPVQEVIPEELGTTVEGESVVVAGGNPEKEVKDTIYGMSKQNTTEGYQLLDLKDGTYNSDNGSVTVNVKDGTITLNATINEVSVVRIPLNKELSIKQGQNYTLYAFNPTINNTVFFRPWNEQGDKQVSCASINNVNTVSYNTDITLSDIIIRVGENQTLTNFVMKPMLIDGSDTTKPYEPFTNGVATPNTNHKQDIEVIDTVNLSGLGTPLNGYTEIVNNTFHKDNTCIGYLFETKKMPNVMTFGSANGNRTNVSYYNEIPVEGTPSKENTLSYASTKTIEVNKTYNYIFIQFSYNITEVNEIMLNKGTELKPYLPYGCIGLVQRGKNLNPNAGVIYTSTSENSKKFLLPKGSYIAYLNDKSKFSNANLYVLLYDKVSQAKITSSGHLTNFYFSSTSYNYYAGGDARELKFETDDDYYVTLGFNAVKPSTGTELMLEEGTIATGFEPYIEPIVHSIDLAEEKLAKATLEDNLNIAVSGEVNLTKNAPEYIVTGDEKWELDTSNRFRVFNLSALKDAKEGVKSLCNIAKWVNWSSADNSFDIRKSSIYFKNNYNYTLEEFKAMLKEKYNSGNPVKIIFNTENPQTIPLPSIKPITLFEGTNIFELVTNLGTTMALTYDYVTPSPSIDRPSEILTVKGSYDTEKSNKNLMDITDIPNWSIKIVKDYRGKEFNLKPNTNYTISQLVDRISSTTGNKISYIFAIRGKYTGGSFASGIDGALVGKPITVKTDTNGVLTVFVPDTEIKKEYGLMLEKGSTATEYVEHQGTTLPLTLTKELLGEIVTLTEEEASNLGLDGAGKYRRTDYGRYICAGNETIIRNTAAATNTYRFAITSIKAKPNISNNTIANVYSNLFVANAPNRNYSNVESITIDTNGFPVIYSDKTKYFTLDQFKALLKEWYDNGEPLEIIYPLENPTYEKITDETELQQLSAYDKQIAFYGVNNINTYTTDDTDAAPLKIHATYSKSNKLTIQSLEDRLASLESQVTNLQDNQI